jgi:60 kDa SS-A/Ro ribonucleoprotein
MSKLNTANTVAKGVSYEGNIQHIKSPEQQLYELAVTVMYGNDTFYESNHIQINRVNQLMDDIVAYNNFDFIANIIIHARTDMHIRTMPIILTIQFAAALRRAAKHYPLLRCLVCDVIQRADQLTDMYAAALTEFKGKRVVPTAIKYGIADAFLKFNAYQIEKYNRKGAVTLARLLRIVHPKAKTKLQGKLFEQIIKDTVPTPYTWETELSINGTLPADQRKSEKQLWTELVQSDQLGYMALLRNLRNIAQADLQADVIKQVTDRLSDPVEVAKSKQLPFRFISAKQALDSADGVNCNNWIRPLNAALNSSFVNVPKIGDNVWIIVDCSGSMEGDFAQRAAGNVPIDTAVLFAAALVKANKDSANTAVTLFSDRAHQMTVNPDDSVITIAEKLRNKVYGGGTNLNAALNQKQLLGFEPDTVVVLSDMQVTSLSRSDVNTMFAPDTVKVAIDLAAYTTSPIGELTGWYQLAGFSDRIFDMIPAMREKNTIKKRFSTPYIPKQIGIPFDLRDKEI